MIPFPRRLVVAALILLLMALVCTQVPLLNYLGYEFSFAVAFVATFIAGFLTITAVKDALRAGTSADVGASAYRAFRQSLVHSLALLLIPLLVMSANALFVKNCSLLEGFGFFLLLPVVTAVFSSALGFFCAVHYRKAKTVFVLFVLATFVEVLAVGYFTPAIFSYNFFYGYFPGLSYDEALGIGWSLIAFRLFTLILAGALVWMAMLLVRHVPLEASVWEKGVTLLDVMVRGRNVVITAALTTLIILVWWFRGDLGFDSTSRYIRHRLGGAYETEHFRISYSPTTISEEEIRWVAAEHEFRLKQISDVLHVVLKGKLESYIYPSADVKQRLIGAGNTNIAKPWSGQVHITQQSLDATLKHELVHVLAAPFGLPVIKASLSTGLVEGLAMALEWDWGNRTLHQYAAAMKKFGVGPDIAAIMSFTGFASHSSSISYVLAGSFCRFLIDTYGIRAMMSVYRTNDYQKAYGKPLQELIAEWRAFLDAVPVSEQDRDAIDVLFRHPPIFQKVCARVVATRNKQAAQAFARKEYTAAAALYRQSYDDGRGYDALSGYLSSALRAGEVSSVLTMFDSVTTSTERPAQFLPLLLPVGLAQWSSGDMQGAATSFARLAHADLGEQLTENAYLCLAAMNDSANGPSLLHYLIAASTDSERLALLDGMTQHPLVHPLPLYLKGKVLLRMKQWSAAYAVLHELRLPQPYLEALRLKMMGTALFRLRRFEEAKLHFWRSLNSWATDVAQQQADEWIQRCEWARQYFTPDER